MNNYYFYVNYYSAQLLSHVRLFATPWTITHQAQTLSMGFPRQECWNGLPFPTITIVTYGIICVNLKIDTNTTPVPLLTYAISRSFLNRICICLTENSIQCPYCFKTSEWFLKTRTLHSNTMFQFWYFNMLWGHLF